MMYLSTLLFGVRSSAAATTNPTGKVMTVKGFVNANDLGIALIHEHILVDFSGAAHYDPSRWQDTEVIRKILPYLQEVRDAGCQTFVDCTPNYLGRDPLLLQKLSALTGLNILTNTGYYGGSDHKFLPEHAFHETPSQLSDRWTREWEAGIGNTTIKPGFIKISVNPDHLSAISQTLVRAAAITHLRTGLTIASHTGPAVAALEEIEILRQEGVSPGAFIWVHAQQEKDWTQHTIAAKAGSWVSLDGLNEADVGVYAEMLSFMKKARLLHRTLVSHDAGWYDPGKPDGGAIRGYVALFNHLIPKLRLAGFSQKEIQQVIRVNPREAFTIRVRRD